MVAVKVAENNTTVYFVSRGRLLYSGYQSGTWITCIRETEITGVVSIATDNGGVYCQLSDCILYVSTDGRQVRYPLRAPGYLTFINVGIFVFTDEKNSYIQPLDVNYPVKTYEFRCLKLDNRMIFWSDKSVVITNPNVELETFTHDIKSVTLSDKYLSVVNSRGTIQVFKLDDYPLRLENLRPGVDCSDISSLGKVTEFYYNETCMVMKTYDNVLSVDISSLTASFTIHKSDTIFLNGTKYPILLCGNGDILTTVRLNSGLKLMNIKTLQTS